MTKTDTLSAAAIKQAFFTLKFQCLFLTSFALVNMSIEPFEVPSFTPEQLSLLKEKLRTTVYPNELEANVGWNYGAPTWAVKPLVQAWLQDFDWEKSRKEMNQWHHYRTTIQDLKIHFIHEPSNHPDAVPLLLINGWPSTFYEYHKVIQPLRDGELGGQVSFSTFVTNNAFLISISYLSPSMWSYQACQVTAFLILRNSRAMVYPRMGRFLPNWCVFLVMTSIVSEASWMIGCGYAYLYDIVVHGSDWGSVIGRSIAVHHKENCKGYHTVMPMAKPPLPTLGNILFHPFKVAKLCAGMIVGFDTVYGAGNFKLKGKNFADVMGDSDAGYRAIQGTRPYTLSQGLSDSPAGLLSKKFLYGICNNDLYMKNRLDAWKVSQLDLPPSTRERYSSTAWHHHTRGILNTRLNLLVDKHHVIIHAYLLWSNCSSRKNDTGHGYICSSTYCCGLFPFRNESSKLNIHVCVMIDTRIMTLKNSSHENGLNTEQTCSNGTNLTW